jgi:hypothetical protein
MCGAKLHVVYDLDAGCPVSTAFTASALSEITARQGDLHHGRGNLCVSS